MTFEEFWNDENVKKLAKKVFEAGTKPKPLTEEEIRACWSKCGKQAPMAFAEELQRKLGLNVP